MAEKHPASKKDFKEHSLKSARSPEGDI
jgi:hypothetical protein